MRKGEFPALVRLDTENLEHELKRGDHSGNISVLVGDYPRYVGQAQNCDRAEYEDFDGNHIGLNSGRTSVMMRAGASPRFGLLWLTELEGTPTYDTGESALTCPA